LLAQNAPQKAPDGQSLWTYTVTALITLEIQRRWVIRVMCLGHLLQNCECTPCCLLPCHTLSAPSHPKAKTCQNVWDSNTSVALTSYLIW